MIQAGLGAPIVSGSGRGSPDPFAGLPLSDASRSHCDRLKKLRGLYVLTDAALQHGRSHDDVVRAAYEGGAGIVQLRDKQLSTRELAAVASRLAWMARQYGRLFVVNDRPDVAAAAGADGAHLGPDDLHPRDARRIMGPHALVGVSVGTVKEAVELAPYASYLAVGAIYGTATKSDAGKPVGPERISQIAAAVPGKPLVAIGGINARNLPAVLAAGAISAAVISSVVTADDIAEAVLQLAQCFSNSA
jgi:thiamine-phosphate pyrophosphorylase